MTMPQQGWAPPPTPPPPWATAPQPRPPRRRRTFWLLTVLAAVLLFLLLLVGAGAYVAGRAVVLSQQRRQQQQSSAGAAPRFTQPAPEAPAPATPGPAPTGSGLTDRQIASITAKVDPGIVDITGTLADTNSEIAGTGIVLSADGLVLTNDHVVTGSSSIRATDVGNGRTYRATVVGYDRTEDIAVLRLTGASGLAVTTQGDSSSVRTGDSVVAIGNAGGTGGTPKAVDGTVTALNRSVTAEDRSSGSAEQLTGLIEIAAAVVPGDSGGPLANANGQVVGVDTAASGGFRYRNAGSGYGYAIPINQAAAIATRIENGQASSTIHIGATAFLGIETGDGNGVDTGASVLGIVPGTPAERAGLTAGDIIVSVNGHAVDSATTLTTLMDRYHPGDRLRVEWMDSSGQTHTATVTAATGPVG